MTRIAISKIHAVAPFRKPGYLEAVMAVSTPVSETHIQISAEDFARIRKEYASAAQPAAQRVPPLPKPAGPGTEMKTLLAKIGIVASPTCSCNKKAKIMDEKGCDWCEEHIDEIDGWLAEEAGKRKLPYLSLAGKALIHLAIRRARKKGNSR